MTWSRKLTVAAVTAGAVALSAAPALAGKASPGGKRSLSSAPTVNISTPAVGTTVSGSVTVAGKAAAGAGIAGVAISVDAGAWQVASGGSSWNTTLDTTALSDGTHSLFARVTDDNGTQATTSESISVDNADTTPPVVSFSSPAAGATVSGTATVAGTASDNVSVSTVELRVDGGSWQTASGTTSWSLAWDSTTAANGSHTLTVRATDPSGNTSTSSETVTVNNKVADTTPPTVGITSPAAGSGVSGTVTVSGTASDNVAVSAVAVQVDGGTWQSVSGTTSWSWSWNTSSLGNGTHTVVARATDSSGNTSTASESVTVSNSTSATSAPDTQGSWVSPEGVHINVNTAGNWTIRQIYTLLLANARDLSLIGPGYTINVQDQYASGSSMSSSCNASGCTHFTATTYLDGAGGSFPTIPDSVLTHEYGQVWMGYYLCVRHSDDWSSYLAERWVSSDGSDTLATDSRTGTSTNWDPGEISADDYRLLFGSSAAVSENPAGVNPYIVDPRNEPGLGNWLLTTWA